MGSGTSSAKPFDYNDQLLKRTGKLSVLVAPEGKNEGAVRRAPDARGGLVDRLIWEDGSASLTIWEAFQHGVKCYPTNKCFGTRAFVMSEDKKGYKMDPKVKNCPIRGEYKWISYSEASRMAESVGKGLVELGAMEGDNIGIFSVNRLEWVLAALGFYSQGLQTVSLYATLGEDAVEYIANHAETKIVLVSKENLSTLLKVAEKIPKMKQVIVFDTLELLGNVGDALTQDDKEAAQKLGVELIGFSELLALGEKSEKKLNPADAEDLCFVMYTSGTTGKPKGVMISHRAVVSVVGAAKDRFAIEGKDKHISYLPLAHIFETVVQVVVLGSGGGIGFYQGNVKKLTEDFKALQPTILCGVPRVFTRVYQKVFQGVTSKNCISRGLFLRSYQSQCELLRQGKPRSKQNDVILSRVCEAVGLTECRIILTGAAPCPGYLMEFLKAVVGATVLQGYGMTETAAGLSITTAEDYTVGHVGPPIACVEVKLRDVPEMGYLHTNHPPTGEICVRGPCVFKGYYKNEGATKETISDDGWLSTGDIGRWNPSGTLSVIDRKKNIFKMSQGEYIAAEKVEGVYGKSPAVGQIWVYGNSFQSFVLATVVPNLEATMNFLKEKGSWTTKEGEELHEAFARNVENDLKAVKDYVKSSLKEQESSLKRFECVRDILLETKVDKEGNGFTVENDCLTPTFKLRRPFLLVRYREALRKCYSNNGEEASEWPQASKKK